MLAQTWSEHCVHKTFRAAITLHEADGSTREIDGLLRSCIRAATEAVAKPWVRSAFVDNAGIVASTTSTSWPSRPRPTTTRRRSSRSAARTPASAAWSATSSASSARPIAQHRRALLRPARRRPDQLPGACCTRAASASGVIAGVGDYGNKIGIPTVNGAIVYDPGYTANPLVFCGCVGVLPPGIRTTDARAGARRPASSSIGGRTGRDGFHGATFSSMTTGRATTASCSARSCRSATPITEKRVHRGHRCAARDRGLYRAITDCGAGGLSSAVGEMARRARRRRRARRDVPRQVPRPRALGGLAVARPRSAWCWPSRRDRLAELRGRLRPARASSTTDSAPSPATAACACATASAPWSDLDIAFLHDGHPASPHDGALAPPAPAPDLALPDAPRDPAPTLLALLAHPNIASKEPVIARLRPRGAAAARSCKPFARRQRAGRRCRPAMAAGAGPRTVRGVAIGNGINPRYGALDPYAMARRGHRRGRAQRRRRRRRPRPHRPPRQLLLGRPDAARPPRRAGRAAARAVTTRRSPTARRSSPARTACTTSTGRRRHRAGAIPPHPADHGAGRSCLACRWPRRPI